MYIYIYTYTYTYTCTCTCTHTHTHTHIQTYTHTHIHTHTYIHTYIQTYMHMSIYVCVCICMYVYIYIYIYTYSLAHLDHRLRCRHRSPSLRASMSSTYMTEKVFLFPTLRDWMIFNSPRPNNTSHCNYVVRVWSPVLWSFTCATKAGMSTGWHRPKICTHCRGSVTHRLHSSSLLGFKFGIQ